MLASINGTALYYTVCGDGPPMLVLHGGLGLDQATLRPWLDGLGRHAQLVFLDVRGCGRSAPLPEDDSTTHETWIDDADALRAHLGVESWTVFGHSYGSFLALEYALRHPARVDGLVLCASAPAFDHAGAAVAQARDRASPAARAALDAALSGPLPSDEAWASTWQALAPLYLYRPGPDLLAAITEGVRYRAGAFNASQGRCIATYDVRDRLGEIDVPALVVSGRHDWICPPAHGALPLAEGIPNAELVVLEESGHFPFIEESTAFETAVGGWLAARA